MTVSIVTITRNNLHGLRQTLNSVLAQECVHIEHIVVDGCSTDGTAEYLRSLQEEYSSGMKKDAQSSYSLRVISREPHGVYDALNVGMQNARGNVIGMLHAGDMYTRRDILKSVVEEFESERKIDYLYGDVKMVRSDGSVLRYYSGAEASRGSLLHGFAPPHPSLFVTRKCMMNVGPYDCDYVICGDFDMFVRLFYSDLRGCYRQADFVEMSAGGISSRLFHRLWTNNREKHKALKHNGLPASYLFLLIHYFQVFKGYIRK